MSAAPWEKYEPFTNPQKQPTVQRNGNEWSIVGEYQDSYLGNVGLIFFMLLWGGIPFGFSIFPLLSDLFDTRLFSSFSLFNLFTLIPLVFVGIAVFTIFHSLRNIYRAWRERQLERPQLRLPDAALHLGQASRFDFERRIRSGRPLRENGTLTARFLCVEVTRRVVGTDTTYEHVIHWEQEGQPVTVYAGTDLLRAHWVFTPPAHLPAQQIGPSHWIVWEVQVRQELPGLTRTTSRFMIPVSSAPPPVPAPVPAGTTTLRDWLNQVP